MNPPYTKRELLRIISKLKSDLVYSIKIDYLPLQKSKSDAESIGNIKSYLKLDYDLALIRDEITVKYDCLMRVVTAYNELLEKG